MNFLTDNLFTIITIVIAPVITWIVTKRHFQKVNLKKASAEAELSSFDVISKNMEIYQNMIEDIETRYEDKLRKRDEEMSLLEIEIQELKDRVKELEDRDC